MKKSILIIFCLGLFINVIYSQNNEKIALNQYQKDAIAFKNYLDPAFPDVSKIKDIQDPTMADYAKQHPSIPLKRNTGNASYDQTEWELKVNEWISAFPYFPQFIEYHKYNYLLSAEDDIIFYNAAKEAWIKRNPDKYKEVTGTANPENTK